MGTIGLSVDCRQFTASLRVGFVFDERLSASRNIRQRIVDLVAGTVSELLERFEFFPFERRLKLAFELFKTAGLASSNGEARRLIKGGGGRLNGAPIASEVQPITSRDLNAEGVIKLSVGKKRHALIKTL